jgi:hypothetical protein
MTNRSIRKMATVYRLDGDGPYIQTGLVQRGLGFGWRLNDLGLDLNELRHFFRLMPVSIGVAVTRAPAETIEQRNKDRETVKRTAHENRAFMVPLMLPAIDIAMEALRDRGVPVIELDTTRSVEDTRSAVLDLAREKPCHAASDGSGREMEVLSPPVWWR